MEQTSECEIPKNGARGWSKGTCSILGDFALRSSHGTLE